MFCAQALVDKFALGSGDVLNRKENTAELPNPFFYRRNIAHLKPFPQFEGLIFRLQSILNMCN